MSNFMDFLKTSGSSKPTRLVSESPDRTEFNERKNEKNEKKEKIKNYRHGNSVLVTKISDTFKGYYGHVTDFFPATYELETEGETYIEASSIMNQDISKNIMTKFGESKVLERIAAIQKESDFFEFIVYVDRETSTQRIGMYVNDIGEIISYLESQGSDTNQAYITSENKNNNFIKELKQDDLVEMMKRLKTNEDDIQDLIDGINSVDLNKKTDSLIELLRNSVESWSPDSVNGDEMLFENGFPVLPKLENFLFDRKISVVFNKDIIGPHHYMVTNGENKGWNNVYKPNSDYYKISYKLVVKYKPNEITVDKQNRKYALIKKGEYSGKKFLITKYNKAKLSVRLTSNNREFIYEPSDVFYFDIKLKNGNIAQVVDTLLGNKLEVKEKIEKNESENDMESGFRTRIISEKEITEKLPGFTLSDTENEREIKESLITNPFDNFYMPSEQEMDEEPIREIYDDEYDEEKSQSGDYEEAEEGHELDREDNLEQDSPEGEEKNSFKDNERTSKIMEELTNKQKEILNQIKKASSLLGYFIDDFDVLSNVENVIECLKTTLKKKSISDYNIKFITVLVIIYEAIKHNIDHDFDKIINKMFKGENSKGFFSVKDLSAENRNDFIFFEATLGDPTEVISKINSLTKNKKQSFNENKAMLKELILYSDLTVQKCLGLKLDIRRKYEMDISKLIPLGINKETGRRLKDEKEENDLMKIQNIRQNYYTSKNIFDDITLPEKEVEINWDYDSKKIISKFIKGLEKKAQQQPAARNIISTIIKNLYRAPFSIRDDQLDKFTKSNFEDVFLKLKNSIIQYKENNNDTIKKENDRINENRKRIHQEKEELFGVEMDVDDTEPGIEEKLTKRQKLFNIENSLRKAQVSANRNSQVEKNRYKKEKKEQ